jgi:hypothetical protein
MSYRRLSVHLEGDWVNAVNPTVFLRVFASSREQLPDLGSRVGERKTARSNADMPGRHEAIMAGPGAFARDFLMLARQSC